MIRQLKNICLGLTIIFSLTSCSDMKVILGIESESHSIPFGIYKGHATLIRTEKLHKDSEGEAPEVEKEVPVKVHFFPKDPELDKGIGTFMMGEDSQRFYWREDGNSVDHWTIQFAKDNSIYSNMNESFNFDGSVQIHDYENLLEGRINISNESHYLIYYMEAEQMFPPSLVKTEKGIAATTDTEFSFDAEKVGSNPGIIKVHIEGGEEKKKMELEIENFEPGGHGKPSKIFVKAVTELGLGEFKLYITRGKYKSNSISVIIQ